MTFPNEYRAAHPLGFKHEHHDPFGWFLIPSPIKSQKIMAVQADGQTEWEHVSVSMRNRCPTWEEMCFVKSLFWSEDEMVIQFHPKTSEYVNLAKTCLHLWRFKGEMPYPPKGTVG